MSDTFSPYQIDYSVKNTSKTFGFSKKKITFKFGVANPPAVEAGEMGADCRGSEHEVIFIWSLNSGKRQILADGKDVHYSETGQNGWTADQVFQHHFQIRVAGLSSPLRAHLITQPANRDVPHIKPFDLRLNGISYFAMPKIFQLGTSQMITRPVKGKGKNREGSGRGGVDDDMYIAPEERQAIAAAKLASMKDLERSNQNVSSGFAPAPAAAPVEDLISFDAPQVAAPPPAQGGVPYGQQPLPQQQQPYSNYSLGASITGSTAGAPPSQQQQQFPGMPQQSPYPVQSSPYASRGSFASQVSQQSQPPPPQQQNMAGSFYGQQQQPTVSRGSFTSQQSRPPQPPQQQPYGQNPSTQPPQQQSRQGSFYGQQSPMQRGSFNYGQQQSVTSLASPSNQTVSSYQSYGSAPSFAQPPQQQRQPMQQPQPGHFYGQPPAAQPQGYP